MASERSLKSLAKIMSMSLGHNPSNFRSIEDGTFRANCQHEGCNEDLIVRLDTIPNIIGTASSLMCFTLDKKMADVRRVAGEHGHNIYHSFSRNAEQTPRLWQVPCGQCGITVSLWVGVTEEVEISRNGQVLARNYFDQVFQGIKCEVPQPEMEVLDEHLADEGEDVAPPIEEVEAAMEDNGNLESFRAELLDPRPVLVESGHRMPLMARLMLGLGVLPVLPLSTERRGPTIEEEAAAVEQVGELPPAKVIRREVMTEPPKIEAAPVSQKTYSPKPCNGKKIEKNRAKSKEARKARKKMHQRRK